MSYDITVAQCVMSLQEIHDYSLSQTTLDDVFIHFASQQSEEAELNGEGAGLVGEGEERRITRHPIYLPDVVASSRGVSTEPGIFPSLPPSLPPSLALVSQVNLKFLNVPCPPSLTHTHTHTHTGCKVLSSEGQCRNHMTQSATGNPIHDFVLCTVR